MGRADHHYWAGLGIAILINGGTNLLDFWRNFFCHKCGRKYPPACSFAGLFCIFLIHRFEECRKETTDVQEAMVDALCKSTTSILSSGLTTSDWFFGAGVNAVSNRPDLGLALAKGVAVSLIIVFLFMPSFVLSAYKFLDKTKHRPLMPSFRKFGAAVNRIAVPTVPVCYYCYSGVSGIKCK